MIVDSLQNGGRYPLGDAWEEALAFLAQLSPDAAEQEYALRGEAMFARVMSYPTKQETDSDAVLEAHRHYADVQMSLVGSERIAVYRTPELRTKTDYDPERDVEFFHYEKPATVQIGNLPGTFTLLLPQDAHMPQLFTGQPGDPVKKVVVKIALDLLDLG